MNTKRKYYRVGFIALLTTLTIFMSITFYQTTYALSEPAVEAQAAILMDEATGKILYAKNEHRRMFPASMTKILTAIVALEYMEPNELVVVGSEINTVPYGSGLAGHVVGESILVENLVRGLMIKSGNESACVLAMETARRYSNNDNLSYVNAEKIFVELMNKKATDLGATDSNFANPHGFHDPNHYSSAYDIAIISQYSMSIPLIKQVAAEISFKGNGAGNNPDPDLKTQEYTWTTHNLLLNSRDYSYPYATGIKTGFTNEAGDCVAASATKKDKTLISVVFFSPEPSRWIDSIALFDYGFDNFDYEELQNANFVIDEAPLDNHKLGESDTLSLATTAEFGDLFSADQIKSIEKEITYLPEFISENKEDGIKLKAPIEKDTIVAHITYSLDNEIIFEDNLVATRQVEQRDYKSDAEYYLNKFKALAFSPIAIPFWISGVAIIILIIRLIMFLANRRRKNFYRIRRRF